MFCHTLCAKLSVGPLVNLLPDNVILFVALQDGRFEQTLMTC